MRRSTSGLLVVGAVAGVAVGASGSHPAGVAGLLVASTGDCAGTAAEAAARLGTAAAIVARRAAGCAALVHEGSSRWSLTIATHYITKIKKTQYLMCFTFKRLGV